MAFESATDWILGPKSWGFQGLFGIGDKQEEAAATAEIPEAPKSSTETAAETINKASVQAKEATRQRQVAARRSRSIFSSPLGLAGEASTVRKTLLGQ